MCWWLITVRFHVQHVLPWFSPQYLTLADTLLGATHFCPTKAMASCDQSWAIRLKAKNRGQEVHR